jgi:hypothetical protein
MTWHTQRKEHTDCCVPSSSQSITAAEVNTSTQQYATTYALRKHKHLHGW